MNCYAKTSSKLSSATTSASGSSAAARNARGTQKPVRHVNGVPVPFSMHAPGRHVRACRSSVFQHGGIGIVQPVVASRLGFHPFFRHGRVSSKSLVSALKTRLVPPAEN
jgi:hypothetical protein